MVKKTPSTSHMYVCIQTLYTATAPSVNDVTKSLNFNTVRAAIDTVRPVRSVKLFGAGQEDINCLRIRSWCFRDRIRFDYAFRITHYLTNGTAHKTYLPTQFQSLVTT